MKTLYTGRFSKSAFLLITVLFVTSWSMAQVKVFDPSERDPNYDAEKRARYTQVRQSNNTSEVHNSNLERSAPAAVAAKATSNCFIPLDASYTAIPRNDDGSFGPIALPFTFDLYGASYTQVWINTNGNLTFTGPYATYSASGFPFNVPMVAPFWGDVDTRNTAGGEIYYKLSATNLIVTWDNVGYYNQEVDKLNEFQVVISDGVDPITGLGQNVCFNYGDMQWTTGSASQGINGFGGTPATVGVNKGNGVDYYQLGRFNVNSAIYDGPGGNPDGINYLDQQCYCSQVSSAVNIAPIANNFPTDTIEIDCGETYNLDFSFIPPEVNQTVSSTVNVNGACGTTFSSTTGSLSDVSFTLIGQQCNEGLNIITFTATDDGTPVETTTVTLYVNVGTCCNLTGTAVGQDISCSGAADGEISFLSSGGTGPLLYSIDGGTTFGTNAVVSGLVPGTYVTLIQDANGCESAPFTVVISEPSPLVATSSATSILCNGGAATVTVSASGGIPPYTGTGSFSVGAGIHTFDVTDVNGCTTSTTVTVAEPTALSVSASAGSILCHGGTADVIVTATGGTAPYSGDGTFNVSAGTYIYTVTDANGCSETVSVTVSEPAPFSVSVSAGSILCNGGTADVTVTATGGTAPYTGVGTYNEGAGTYTYVVLDANGCSDTVSITLTEPSAIMAFASCPQIACFGGTADVAVFAFGGTPPYTGTGVFNVGAGSYTYTVTDANGCSETVSITVTEPTQLNASASSTVIPCFGGTSDVTVSASGGTPPYIGTGTYTVSAGTHTYTVTDANGCSVDVTVVVDQPAQIEANITPQNHVIDCIPIPVTLTANPTGGSGGPYTYLWSTGETTASIEVNPNITTNYTVEVWDANGCTVNTATNGTTVTVLNRCGNNNQKVVICHVPPGNTGNPQTICISPNALNPHLSTLWDLHGGDYCGPCQESSALTLGNTNAGDNTFIRAGINSNNETIELSYRIGYDSQVRLEIYDMAGVLVEVVHTSFASEGELYDFKLNTTKISSGVYLYQFITDSEKHIDKLQIIQ